MELLDLPLDVLRLIFERLGGAALRANVGLLSVSRAWYPLAQPVYLSGLDLASIRLSARTLERFPPDGRQLALVGVNAKRLAVRLRGHFWDDVSAARWESHDSASSGDEEVEHEEDEARNVPTIPFHTREGRAQLNDWKERINNRLEALADTLPHFDALEAFTFEALSEIEQTIGPRWDYLYDRPIASLLSRLPNQGLASLTLDTCGTALVPRDEDGTPVHICPLIQRCLRTVQHVRVRMRTMCSRVLLAPSPNLDQQHNTPWNHPSQMDTETDLLGESFGEYRLESLTIKLNLPMFPDAWNGGTRHLTQPCTSTEGPRGAAYLHKDIARAAKRIRQRLPNIECMRISYPDPAHGAICLEVLDCLTENVLVDPGEIYYYEEDVPPIWWEDTPDLAVVDTFDYGS